jgi:hypothetical protein
MIIADARRLHANAAELQSRARALRAEVQELLGVARNTAQVTVLWLALLRSRD